MPRYDYYCPNCGVCEEFQHMREDTLEMCPRCQAGYTKLISKPSGAMEREYRTPIELLSVAPANEAEEIMFRQRNPDAEMKDGVPIARTRKQKLRILKNEGFEEKN